MKGPILTVILTIFCLRNSTMRWPFIYLLWVYVHLLVKQNHLISSKYIIESQSLLYSYRNICKRIICIIVQIHCLCTALELICSNGLIAYTEVSFARDISSLVMFAFSHMLWKMCRASKSSKGVPNSST